MMEIKKRSPHYHRLDDYELCFHLSMTEKLSKLSGPRHWIGLFVAGGALCVLQISSCMLESVSDRAGATACLV
jgi:hypothetical protein